MPGAVAASPEAQQRWFDDGLVAGSARIVGATLSFMAEEVSPLWESAVAEGVVTGSLAGWLRGVVEGFAGQPLPRSVRTRAATDVPDYLDLLDADLLALIAAFLATEGAHALAEAQALCFDAKLLERLAEIHGESVHGGWSDERLDEELRRLALIWGGAGLTEQATMAAKFFEREILSGAVHGALHELRAPSKDLFPYMMYRASPGARANHALLDGFVWRTGHPIEPIVISPNGWSCRCRPIPISWEQARRLGWSGDFPLGTAKALEFLRAGGADAGFPKGVFTQGLPESLAGC